MSSTHSWNVGKTIWNALLGDYFKNDPITGAQTTIDYEHHEIHEGDHFYTSGFNTLGSNGSVVIGLAAPATGKQAHLTFSLDATNQTEYRIYEYGTYTGGASFIPFNSNRNSTGTSALLAVVGPSVSDTGTLIESQSSGLAAANPSRASITANSRRGNEIVLKYDTKYLIETTSKADDNIVSYQINWYEHTPSN